MKTTIIIEHADKSDLSSILGKVSTDVSLGYTKSSGVLPAYVPVAVAVAPYPPGYAQPEQCLAQGKTEILISTYEFYTEE